MSEFDDSNGRNLPRDGANALPDYYLYGHSEIPVRVYETTDGGKSAEYFNLKTNQIERGLWFIAEIYSNPGTSTDIERVSAAVYEQRVNELRDAREANSSSTTQA